MNVTWPMFVWGFGILIAWTAFLLGIIKYLLTRQLSEFVTKQSATDAKATEAVTGLANHKQTVNSDIAALRLEISQKIVCSNHGRMESDNKDQFVRMDQLNGQINKIDGKINGLVNSIDLLLKHHINGGD